MKHGRHSSEYDKVRRAAGLDRPRYQPPAPEFPDDDAPPPPVFDDDFRARMADHAEQEKVRLAEAKAAADALTHRSNSRVKWSEYDRAGVEPPQLDENGEPRYSLSFLLKMGWRVERVGDRNVLTNPQQRKVPDAR